MSPAQQTIGLVGVGAWGSRLLRHLSALGAEVVCYGGRSEASRDRVREIGDYRLVSRIEDLLADTAIDAIAIATPPDTHAAIAMSALNAGKHVFVEKPLCLTMHDLELISRLAVDGRRVLFTGYTISYHPVIREIERMATDGQMQSMWSSVAKHGSFDSDLVSTLLAHDLAVVDRIAGHTKDWKVCGQSGPHGNPDAVNVSFHGSGGAMGVLRVDRSSPTKRRELAVQIGEGVFRWDGGPRLLGFAGGTFYERFSSPVSALEAELREFLQALAADAPDRFHMDRELRVAESTIRVRDMVLA